MLYVTRQRSFDYIRLHWLERTSGRPIHEWDLYVIKELLDNALDADERQIPAHEGSLEIAVAIRYTRTAELLNNNGHGCGIRNWGIGT